jgi:hypothetical protein
MVLHVFSFWMGMLICFARMPSLAMMPAESAERMGREGHVQKDSLPVNPDRQPPVIRFKSVTPPVIRTANHAMIDVYLDYLATDNSGMVSTTLLVESNEALTGLSGGDKFPDWEIVNDRHVRLRAERSPNRIGRIYTISIRASDTSGNSAERYVHIEVPRNLQDYDRKVGWYNADKEPTNEGGDLSCRVFPNPATNYFDIEIISTNSNDVITVNISDVNGKPLDVQKVWHDKIVRVGQDLARGTYYAEVRQGDQLLRIQLTKQ